MGPALMGPALMGLALMGLALSCSAPPPRAQPRPWMPPPPVNTVAPAPQRPVLDMPDVARAAWYAPRTEDNRRHGVGDVESEQVGQRSSIVKTERGYYWVGKRVRGPLEVPPDTVALGLLNDDKPLAITTQGVWWEGQPFTQSMQMQHVKDPSRVDIAGSVVAVASGSTLRVSIDAGKRFRALQLPGEVTKLFARTDGVVVALTKKGTVVSKKGGWWARSVYEPVDLKRRGAWIYDRKCGVVLSRDGRRWFDALDSPQASSPEQKKLEAALGVRHVLPVEKLDAWRHALSLLDGPALAGRGRYTIDTPPAPAMPAGTKGIVGKADPCSRPPTSVTGLVGGRGCRGIACIKPALGEEPRDGEVAFRVFADDASTVALIEGDGAPRALEPAPCPMTRLLSVGGAGVVVCRSGRVVTIDGDGKYHEEGMLAPMHGLVIASVARDGTLIVASKKHAFIRGPLPLGATGAWRPLDGHAALPLSAGRALVVKGMGKGVIDVHLHASGMAPQRVARAHAPGVIDLRLQSGKLEMRVGRQWRPIPLIR